MNTVPPDIQSLARRLIALEAARAPAGGPVDAAVRACEKLRVPLARLAGVAGFRSLLGRAVALAAAGTPGLDSVRVLADGALDGFDAAGHPQGGGAGVAIVAELLGLLVTFIGEPLTLGLVRDAWPDAPLDETGRTAGGQA